MWKSLSLCFLLLVMCSCAPMYTQKTEAELKYDDDGRPLFKLYNSKAYQGLTIDVKKKADGTMSFSYEAKIVDSNTVAAEVAKSNGVLAEGLKSAIGLVGMVPGL